MATTTTTTANRPLPSPPFIKVEGLPNFRDCGGYPIAGQPRRAVRRGVLYRSSEPSMITDRGIATLDRLGITHVYDLRSQAEIDRDARSGRRDVKVWDGARRIFVPVFSREDYSPEAIALRYTSFSSEGSEGFVRVYSDILEGGSAPQGPRAFPRILRHLAASPAPPAPLLVHCTAGKDRTGVLCALALSLCGVADEAVACEYSLTDLGLGERKEEFISHIVREPSLKGDRAAAARMVGSRKESMMGTLAMIREKYGSVEGYVLGPCGLEPSEVEQIRRNLVVDVRDGEAPLDWKRHAKLTE